MAEQKSWNYKCDHCDAKLLRRRRREPPKSREQAFCPYCTRPLPAREGADTLGYELVEAPGPKKRTPITEDDFMKGGFQTRVPNQPRSGRPRRR
jgi:hypothetical protein